jgi:xylulokinase
MSTILSIDLGTTGLKAGLVTIDGRVEASASQEYSIDTPAAGYAEQDPEKWWQALISCCRSLKESHPKFFSQVEGIGICGQMHTQAHLDSSLRLLRPAITWMDQRSSSIADRINGEKSMKAAVFAETQNVATTTYTATHLKWIKDNQPDIWSKISHVLVAKDFLKYRLTGEMVIDYSDASGTLLFNVKERHWSEAMFKLFGVPPAFLPEVKPSDEIIGTVTQEAAKATGLRSGTPVANGSADCSTAALGAGMVRSGQVTLIIGTAGVVAVCADQPLPDAKDRTICWNYCLRDKWVMMGITQTAGESLNWFRTAFDQNGTGGQSSKDVFEQYNNAIRDIPDGSDGLIFLPYLNGERTPYWDSNARGVFFGINLATRKAHFIKAIMEGVSFALRNCMETLESLGITVDQVMAVGGGLKSETWLNTLGKIVRKPIRTVGLADTGLVGNMLICSKALGLISSIPETVKKISDYDQDINFPDAIPEYEKQYKQFLRLYDDLKIRFSAAASTEDLDGVTP